MSTYQTPGLILKIADRHEADQLFSIFTLKAGKISALGRGTKKIQSKLNGQLQIFSLLDLMVASGRNYDHLAAAEMIKNFSGLKNDLRKIVLAAFGLEAVDKLTKLGCPEPEIYRLLEKYLAFIDKNKLDAKSFLAVKQKFIIRLLAILGLAPGQAIAADQKKLDNFLNQHLDFPLNVDKFLVKMKVDKVAKI